jgi:putative FmdB family regulatory protein
MPIYQYKCKKCGEEFEKFQHIDDRYETKCKCGGDTKILIKPQKNFGIHVWIPYMEENICHQPVMVESKQHLKDLCKEHGVHAVRLD